MRLSAVLFVLLPLEAEIRTGLRGAAPFPPNVPAGFVYWAVAQACVLGALSVSIPASNTPLPLQSFQDVTT